MKKLLLFSLLLLSTSAFAWEKPYKITDDKTRKTFDDLETNVVDIGSNQTITGTKTFTSLTATSVSISTLSVTNTITANEVVSTYGFYHDRGSVSGYDLITASFTIDSDWHTRDLSSIVPSDAKAIYLKVIIKNVNTNILVAFAKNGSVNEYNASALYSQVTNIYNSASFIVPCTTGRTIDYYVENSGSWEIKAVIMGWFK